MRIEEALAFALVVAISMLLTGIVLTPDAAIVAAGSDGNPTGSGKMVLSLSGSDDEGSVAGGEGGDNEGPAGTGSGASQNSNTTIVFPKIFNHTIISDGRQADRNGFSFVPEETSEEEEIIDLCLGFQTSVTSCGIGACAASGYTSCFEGQVTDTCAPLQPSEEVCSDGIDNDCDGYTDCSDESCVRDDSCIEEAPSAPEFMFVVIPVGIIALMLLFSYNAAKKKQ